MGAAPAPVVMSAAPTVVETIGAPMVETIAPTVYGGGVMGAQMYGAPVVETIAPSVYGGGVMGAPIYGGSGVYGGGGRRRLWLARRRDSGTRLWGWHDRWWR